MCGNFTKRHSIQHNYEVFFFFLIIVEWLANSKYVLNEHKNRCIIQF